MEKGIWAYIPFFVEDTDYIRASLSPLSDDDKTYCGNPADTDVTRTDKPYSSIPGLLACQVTYQWFKKLLLVRRNTGESSVEIAVAQGLEIRQHGCSSVYKFISWSTGLQFVGLVVDSKEMVCKRGERVCKRCGANIQYRCMRPIHLVLQ